ncbi:MAG: TonB C-terminal domain-containing protein [Blastocatellia bacterium]|nr:TonB C-terminal domain-containing protein [Blastocatellia bacterium]
MELNDLHQKRGLSSQGFGKSGLISAAAHLVLFLFLFVWMGRSPDVMIIAAGEGEGGGGGGAIQIGIADAAELGFAKPQKVNYQGSDPNETVNNVKLKHEKEQEQDPELLLTKKEKKDEKEKKTNLPVAPRIERTWSSKPREASSQNNTADAGRSYGSRKPGIVGGIGIGEGDNSIGTGLPGGSEYGRRIQNILSRNFTPPQLNVTSVSNVIIYVKIARDGRITSVAGGRVPKTYFKKNSPYEQLNFAAERAIIATATQGLPPFPNGFLNGVQEAVAEVWFQYP